MATCPLPLLAKSSHTGFTAASAPKPPAGEAISRVLIPSAAGGKLRLEGTIRVWMKSTSARVATPPSTRR
jgi:hypothetical protein